MWPAAPPAVPVMSWAAQYYPVQLWASGSSDCSNECFIIFSLIAECKWMKSNSTIELCCNVGTDLHRAFSSGFRHKAFCLTFVRLQSFITCGLAQQMSLSAEVAQSGTISEMSDGRMACCVLLMVWRLIFHFLEGRVQAALKIKHHRLVMKWSETPTSTNQTG